MPREEDDGPPTLPPILFEREAPSYQADERTSAIGDYRYQHTAMTVEHVLEGFEVRLRGQHDSARFHLHRGVATRLADEIDRALRKYSPRMYDDTGLLPVPPAPPPAPRPPLEEFPMIHPNDDPSLNVGPDGSFRLEISVVTRMDHIHITVGHVVAIWLYSLLSERPLIVQR